MTGNDESEERIVYSKKLSDYFYPKLTTINNENNITNEDDFNENDILEYELDENDGEIDISSTKKLIKYLKSLILVNVKNLNSKIDTKLDIVDYVIDNQLNSSSQNPLANNVIYDTIQSINSALNTKANIRHTHNISDVTSLNTTLDSKANSTDLSSHISDKNNPHGITLSQLGLTDNGWGAISFTQSYLAFDDAPYCRKYGKIVALNFMAQAYKNYAAQSTLFTLRSEYRPDRNIYTFAFIGSTPVTCVIRTDGTVALGSALANDKKVRIYECYLTS